MQNENKHFCQFNKIEKKNNSLQKKKIKENEILFFLVKDESHERIFFFDNRKNL